MKLLNLASNDSFWRGIDYHHDVAENFRVTNGVMILIQTLEEAIRRQDFNKQIMRGLELIS